MSQIVVDCPHCGAKSLGMTVFGSYVPSPTTVSALSRPVFFHVAAICGKCCEPVSATLTTPDTPVRSWNDFLDRSAAYLKDTNGSPEIHSFHTQVVLTPDANIQIPDHLPSAVEKSLNMAEVNFRLPDMEEASAAMYRRAIDIAVRNIAPDGKGDLIKRINNLADEGKLPGTMKDWAHQVRIIGNDGAHDIQGVTRKDLEAAQGFTDALLRYLFTLPKEVELRRATTEIIPALPEANAGD